MSFFKKIFGFFAAFGVVLFLFSLLFVAFIVWSPTSQKTPREAIYETYLEEEIQRMEIQEDENTVYIHAVFQDDHTESYYLAYAYHYFDTTNKEIQFIAEESDASYFVTINKNGESSIVIHEKEN